jgi:5-(carboxyamino)imidazole ribonucleotide mutase
MKKIPVAIVMGSKSDLETMKQSSDILKEFGIEHSIFIISAHRSPNYLREFLEKAEKNGISVYIAGAGGAAHLAGVLASYTTKPVIGVPLSSKLSGLDSLLSTLQMPKEVPVATVAIDNAANAALLALQILAISDNLLAEKLKKRKKELEEKIRKTKL